MCGGTVWHENFTDKYASETFSRTRSRHSGKSKKKSMTSYVRNSATKTDLWRSSKKHTSLSSRLIRSTWLNQMSRVGLVEFISDKCCSVFPVCEVEIVTHVEVLHDWTSCSDCSKIGTVAMMIDYVISISSYNPMVKPSAGVQPKNEASAIRATKYDSYHKSRQWTSSEITTGAI